ncbi:DUF5110 domain-containing protein [Levilactobacillus brevis]|nr:DUF5110 domain-containing protein [Levilactobacillus brevis]
MNLHNDVIDKLDVLIEPSRDAEFVVYEDDGVTNNYRQGETLETTIKTTATADGVVIDFGRVGQYQTQVKTMALAVCCPKIAPLSVDLADRSLPRYLNAAKFADAAEGWYFDGESRQVQIKYANPEVADYAVKVNFSVKDLISI